jgi:hypothetical protein
MIAIAQMTDLRAAWAVGTVKKRIRMCGSPAVPSTSAMPSEIWSIGFLKSSPGSRKRCPSSAAVMFFAGSPSIAATRPWMLGSSTAACRNAGRLKPYGAQTSATMMSEAITSRIAFTIWT